MTRTGIVSVTVRRRHAAVLLFGTVAASLLATVWPTFAESRMRPVVTCG